MALALQPLDGMNPGIYPLLLGGLAQQRRLEVVANNLANLQTSGFKRDVPLFRMVAPSPQQGNLLPPELVYVAFEGIQIDLGPGPIQHTGVPLDLAIDGPGFFVVQGPEGPRYTRAGHFQMDAGGQVVTPDGLPLLGEGGPIVIPPGREVTIDPEGRVLVDGVEVDRLRIVELDPETLQKEGEGLFRGEGERPAEGYRILQGALEGSNVDPFREMVQMIEALRGFEAYRKALNTLDDLERRIQEVGRVER